MSHVAEVIIYPIKSCKGISVQEARITSIGFLFDRHWMVVHASSGRCQTQRQLPRMALIGVAVDADVLAGTASGTGRYITLSAPDMPDIKVPLAAPSQISGDALKASRVWEWSGPAYDIGEEVGQWLTTFLGKPCRLVRFLGSEEDASGECRRQTDPEWAPGSYAAFADGFPLLLASKSSLKNLNDKVATPLDINRFRANLVIDNDAPWTEDTWQTVTVGEVTCAVVKPCGRCTVTTVDQSTGHIAGNEGEPLNTLRTFRKGSQLGWQQGGLDKELCFGVNMTVQGSGTIRVGDRVEVKETRSGWTPISAAA